MASSLGLSYITAEAQVDWRGARPAPVVLVVQVHPGLFSLRHGIDELLLEQMSWVGRGGFQTWCSTRLRATQLHVPTNPTSRFFSLGPFVLGPLQEESIKNLRPLPTILHPKSTTLGEPPWRSLLGFAVGEPGHAIDALLATDRRQAKARRGKAPRPNRHVPHHLPPSSHPMSLVSPAPATHHQLPPRPEGRHAAFDALG